MQIIETIRGIGLGGAETLLLTRLGASNAAPWRAITKILNTAPQYADLSPQVAALTAGYEEISSGRVLSGAVATFRHGRTLDPSTVVISHSPASSIGFKLRKAIGSKFLLIDVVHASSYRRQYLWLGRLLDRYVDHAICVSREVANAPTARNYRTKSVLLGGVDRHTMRDWVTGEGASEYLRMRDLLGLDCDARLIANIANLKPPKNQAALIRSLYNDQLHGVHLALVGDGPDRRALEDLAADLGIGNRVHFIGRVPDGWRWAAVADLVVHSSHFEGLPVALMEAAALGVPIVTTPLGGTGDLTDHGAQLTLAATDADLPRTIAQALENIPSIVDSWPSRAALPSYWEIGRYSEDFYDLVSALHRNNNSPRTPGLAS